MQGKIVKGISGFYYVHVGEPGIYECKAKGAFRNQKIKPLVGDDVEIAIVDEETKKGNIEKILPRKNELIRPAVANIDLALIIFAAAKPQPNFNLLDRFLIMMEYQDVPVTICFNKKDLLEEQAIEEFAGVYKKCGYSVLYTSAEKEEGIRELHELLDGRTTAVAGPSGVGKSSLVNRWRLEVSAERSSVESIRHAIRRSYRSQQIHTLWIHRDSVRYIFRDLRRKICRIFIRSSKSMSRIAGSRDAVISASRTAV